MWTNGLRRFSENHAVRISVRTLTVGIVLFGAIGAGLLYVRHHAPSTGSRAQFVSEAGPVATSAMPFCDPSELRRAMARNDGEIGPDEQNSIATFARTLLASSNNDASSCRQQLFELVASNETCAKAFETVATVIVSERSVDANDVRGLLERVPRRCQPILLASFPHLNDVNVELVRWVGNAAREQEDAKARVAFFEALGTLGAIARRKPDRESVRWVDDTLRDALAQHKGGSVDEYIGLLEGAGNCGCETCTPFLLDASSHPSPDVRLAAAGAWRFHSDEKATESMCSYVLHDSEASVREHAAWALRWRTSEVETRVNCLVAAAVRDESGLVRLSAVQSISGFVRQSRHARRALLFLREKEQPPDTRKRAEEAIAANANLMLFDAKDVTAAQHARDASRGD